VSPGANRAGLRVGAKPERCCFGECDTRTSGVCISVVLKKGMEFIGFFYKASKHNLVGFYIERLTIKLTGGPVQKVCVKRVSKNEDKNYRRAVPPNECKGLHAFRVRNANRLSSLVTTSPNTEKGISKRSCSFEKCTMRSANWVIAHHFLGSQPHVRPRDSCAPCRVSVPSDR